MMFEYFTKMVPSVGASRLSAVAFVALMTFSLPSLAAPAPAPQERPDSFADLADKLMPTVVNISTAQTVEVSPQDIPQFPPGSPFEEFFKDFFEGPNGAGPRKMRSLGSGFIIDSKGLIVTNNHVIEEADEIEVTLSTGLKLPAEVVGHDPKTDIAVLKVKTTQALPAARFGNSNSIRVGDWVLAIGNPFGLGGTLTAGIISARSRDIGAGPYDDFLQTDAAINRGNSGGPLFNLQGEVVGINAAIISPSGGSIGIGFAVPSSAALPVIDQLRKYGETRRGWLGVRIQTVTDEIADSLGLGKSQGALIAGVNDNGPADKAGLRAGDVVIEFNGKPIKEMRELPKLVADTEIGKTVKVVALRKGQRVAANVVLGRLEDAETAMAEAAAPANKKAPAAAVKKKSLGLSLTTITPQLRQNYGVAKDLQGVLVVAVDGASDAADKGLAPGDVIVEVNQHPVRTPDDVEAQVIQSKKEGRKSVLIMLSREGTLSFTALKL